MPYIPWKPHFDNFLTANSNGPVKRAFKCKMHCSIVKITSLIAYSAINVTATLSQIHNTNDISVYTCMPRNHRIINIVHICARCTSSNIPFFLSDLCIQYTVRSLNIFTFSCSSKFRQTFLETMDRHIEAIYRKTSQPSTIVIIACTVCLLLIKTVKIRRYFKWIFQGNRDPPFLLYNI